MPSKATRCKCTWTIGHVDCLNAAFGALSQHPSRSKLAKHTAACALRSSSVKRPFASSSKDTRAKFLRPLRTVNPDGEVMMHLLDRRLLPATCARAFTREPRPIMAFAEMDLVWAKVVDHLPHRGANSLLILLPPDGPLCCDPVVSASQRRNRLCLSRWMCIRKKGEPSLISKRTSKRQARPHSTSQSFFEQASLALFARAPQSLAQWSPTGPSARGPLRRAVAPPLAPHPARD